LEQVVRTSGTASRELAPERAEWTLGVRAADPNPRVAFDRCAERLAALAQTLAEAGEVTTGRVEVDVERERRRGEAHTRRLARATLTVAGAVERAGELAAAAMGAGADEISGPVFRVGDAEAVTAGLLADAVRDARRRAEAMATAAGRSLGRAVAISDHHSGIPYYEDDGELMSRGVAVAAVAEPPVRPRPRTVSATVEVVFELVDAAA